MEGDALVPSLSNGSVGSRFVTETAIDKARAQREEQWKAAYARLGQEPPKRPDEDAGYDGRSLYEKLATNRAAKQEEWEEKNKLSNQFRTLEEDEVRFLDSILDKQIEEDRKRKDRDGEEVKGFKAAVAARETATISPLAATSTDPSSKPKAAVAAPKTIPKQKTLKGIIVAKKKTKPAPTISESAVLSKDISPDQRVQPSPTTTAVEGRDAKRRRVGDGT